MLHPDRLRRVLVLGFLFVSGGTALVYQIVWSKYLANQLGNSGQAHSVVLATFMGGLALGAWVFGRHADRVKSPLAMYGLLELGTGLYALAFPAILSALGAAYLWIAPALPEGARIIPKLLLAASSLVVPTMLMGGTLPALARHFTENLGGMQRELARLYALNSLGAALGVFVSGVRLLPNFGLSATSTGAAIVNIGLAAGVLVLTRGRAAPPVARAEEADADSAALMYPRRAVRAALWGVAFSGFTSMLYEVTWIRILAITQGASTYAFSLILTAFILGIGLGSYWLSTREDTGALRLFGRLQLLLVMALCLAVPLYVRLPWLFWRARYLLHRTVDAWPLYQLFTFSFCCLVLLVPTFFMGAAFPAAARVATAKISELGTKLGGVYLWNTVGTISGAALGGLVLLPAIGMEGNILLGIGCNVAAGLYALWADGEKIKSRVNLGFGAALVVGLVVLGSEAGWSKVFSNSGAIHLWSRPPSTFQKYQDWVMDGVALRYRKDDTFATVVVAETPKGHRYIRMNGKTDASNGADIKTQILAGHLGALFHAREPKNVLLIGSGAAITAGSILAHPIERLDLVEISPAVLEAAQLFAPDNRNALADPRTHVHIEDAKTFMALAPYKYDLVISVPSNPWVAGVSGLFTREFFQKTRDHLADDGVLVQWLQTYETSESMVALVVRTLRETFPYATTWEALPADLVLLTSRQPMTLDVAKLEERMSRPEVKADLARADVVDVATLLSMQVHSPEGQLEFAGEGPINTDDLNLLEYGSPIALFIDHEDMLRVKDERRAPDGGRRLFFAQYLAQHPLTAEEAEHIFVQHEKHRRWIDPLVRASAEMWFRVAPGPKSRAALAESLLAIDDLDGVHRLVDPALEKGELTQQLMVVALELERRETMYRRSSWNPATARPELVREATARFGDVAEVKKAIDHYCGAFLPGECRKVPQAQVESGSTQ
ncbi:MAG: spermidine synthase [Myxococcaceae bacterium]|nr:spermidine synthase [Myxococcaceae bacterium]